MTVEINLCVENLFKDRTHVDNLSKDSFRELLATTMSESLILFDQEFVNSMIKLQLIPY